MTKAEKAAAYIVGLIVIYFTFAGVALGPAGILIALVSPLAVLLLWVIWQLIALVITDD